MAREVEQNGALSQDQAAEGIAAHFGEDFLDYADGHGPTVSQKVLKGVPHADPAKRSLGGRQASVAASVPVRPQYDLQCGRCARKHGKLTSS